MEPLQPNMIPVTPRLAQRWRECSSRHRFVLKAILADGRVKLWSPVTGRMRIVTVADLHKHYRHHFDSGSTPARVASQASATA